MVGGGGSFGGGKWGCRNDRVKFRAKASIFLTARQGVFFFGLQRRIEAVLFFRRRKIQGEERNISSLSKFFSLDV